MAGWDSLICYERVVDQLPSRFHYLSVGGGDPFLLLLQEVFDLFYIRWSIRSVIPHEILQHGAKTVLQHLNPVLGPLEV